MQACLGVLKNDVQMTCRVPIEAATKFIKVIVRFYSTLVRLMKKKTFHTTKCKKQRKFDPYRWERSPVQEVATLLCGIDGLAVYILTNVLAGNDQQTALLSDERKW